MERRFCSPPALPQRHCFNNGSHSPLMSESGLCYSLSLSPPFSLSLKTEPGE
ncbi:unnamed protein product [Spirodela intermedia]|uniref:Uncharacterized protein n=1 Tax=Spirodela intermedia TaxID=51605 RepID=A0A7I8KFS7_SPIIN|nr:unnamed protein product [Spirodela intermedia]